MRALQTDANIGGSLGGAHDDFMLFMFSIFGAGIVIHEPLHGTAVGSEYHTVQAGSSYKT